MRNRGSALYIHWKCSAGHDIFTWCSQTKMPKKVHSGDLKLSAAVLFSGNNFQKISLLAKYLNLPMLSSSAFHRFQTCYVVPAVESVWETHISELKEAREEKELVVLGDGRMDSPGYCAQYCTYTAMDNDTKEILSVITIDKRETGKCSVRMEKEALVRTICTLKENLNVVEVVTDGHTSIASYMRKECPDIKHSLDVWHVGKNLAKKIMKAGKEKKGGPLKMWCKHIVNHFYYTCQTAQSEDEFRALWFGMLHHVVDEHNWSFGLMNGLTSCMHGPLTSTDVPWLQKDSCAYEMLRSIVGDRRFIQQIPYFLNARSTAELEGLQNLILMYSGKRFSYKPPVYRARNLLAALDHNHHLNRHVRLNKDGNERLHRMFNKSSGRWSARKVKTTKEYSYRNQLMKSVLSRRIMDNKTMFGKVILLEADPRRLSCTIAPVDPPETKTLLEELKSRFNKPK